MKRQFVLALMLPLTFATPGVAQSTADMGRQFVPYGPPRTAQEEPVAALARSPAYLLPPMETQKLPTEGPRIMAGTELGPDALLGVGTFKANEGQRPFSAPREQSRNSRIAAIGLAVKF